MSTDPIALIQAAKHRAYAYKGPASSGVLGQDYTPSILQGRNITQNPAGAAALSAQGVKGANTPQIAGRPASPLNPVEPTANGQTLPGFAEGGEVISKVSQMIKNLLAKYGSAAVPAGNDDAHLALLRKSQSGQLSPEEQKQLISNLAAAPQARTAATPSATNAMVNPSTMAATLRSQHIDPRNLDALRGQDPSLDKLIQGYTNAAVNGEVTDDIRSALANKLDSMGTGSQGGGFAEGGSTEHEDMQPSSLKWISDMARHLGGEHGARLATGVAKQFYGLDENGNPVLGGRAWLSSQHGTPPRILDEVTSIPSRMLDLSDAVNGPSPKGTEGDIGWSRDAAARLDALDQKVKQTTGVGDPHTLPEHLEDAASSLITPFPASKAIQEAPMARRLFEYLTPVRPNTLGRFATDSTVLGGLSAGIDKLADRVAAKKAPVAAAPDPTLESMQTPEFGDGGEVTRRAILKMLGATAAAAPLGFKAVERAATEDPQQALAKVAARVQNQPPKLTNMLQDIKDHAFGHSDEPSWGYLDKVIPTLPSSETVIPHYQAMKQAFHAPLSPEDLSLMHEPGGYAESVLHPTVNRFEQSLDDLAAKHGVAPAVNPNE